MIDKTPEKVILAPSYFKNKLRDVYLLEFILIDIIFIHVIVNFEPVSLSAETKLCQNNMQSFNT